MPPPGHRAGDPRARPDEFDRVGLRTVAGDDQRGAAVGGEAGVGHRIPFVTLGAVEPRGFVALDPARIARYTLRGVPAVAERVHALAQPLGLRDRSPRGRLIAEQAVQLRGSLRQSTAHPSPATSAYAP